MMNRQGPLRPLPFGQPPPQQQSGRPVAARGLPKGPQAAINNSSNWGFGNGGGISMGGNANLTQGMRPLAGGNNLSFAQSLMGSQQSATLDPSEFPSLSNTAPNQSSPASMWAQQPSRNIGGGAHRGPQTPLSAQQGQQDDLFTSSRLTSTPHSSFRFGNQGAVSQAPQGGQADEFPPLNRPTNGEIGGQERGPGLMSNIGFGPAGTPSGGALHTNRAGNGLLNALSATSRTREVISPTSVQRSQGPRSPVDEEESRQKPPGYREDSLASHTSGNDAAVGRNPLGAIGNDAPLSRAREEDRGQHTEIVDPLEGMTAIDRWGIKGHQTLMNNFPDYSVIAHGIEPAVLGLDMRSNDMISTQIYSLFNAVPPRPAIPKFKLPECYEVKNVQPIDAKIPSFNEETLMWIFYSCPRDIKQQMAAVELMNRNWRWHKRLQLWLTKDDLLVPQNLSQNTERGYYIVWDKDLWRKERRELTLHYADLDTTSASPPAVA